MRTPVLIAIVALAACSMAAAAEPIAASASGPQMRVPTAVPASGASAPPSPSIRVEYRKPRNASHQSIYTAMREHQFLEHIAEVLSVVRLPRPLTLVFQGCDGDSNAYYVDKTATVLFCYEFLDDIRRAAAAKKTNLVVPMQDALNGPTLFVMLHEAGHAVFEQLKVPVLGRMEDAADTFSAINLLRMGKDYCRRMLAGAAWAYGYSASTGKLDESDFSDSHSLDSQRYYNLLCLAYGSDPKYFAELVTRNFLPKARAEGCVEEYHQAVYALQKLVMPSLDEREWDRRTVGPQAVRHEK